MELRWGIVGLGKIANAFVNDLLQVEGSVLHAVASRNMEKAQNFAEEYQAKSFYCSYLDLLNDEEVDIIYIATPHNLHSSYAIQAMNKGKHVLCEKPLAINAKQVQQMIDSSCKNKVFLMEAMWTKFNPSIVEIHKKIQEGIIGKIRYVNADFAFPVGEGSSERLFNPQLAGGTILDIGVYPIFLSYLLMGIPDEVIAKGILSDKGIDMQVSASFYYEQSVGSIFTSFYCKTDMEAIIVGEKGSIKIHSRWHESQGYSLTIDDETKDFKLPTLGKGFTYEIKECQRCISQGLLQSKLWSHKNSLEMIGLADEIRRQIGVHYPME